MSINPNIPANFTPTLGQYKPLSPFRFWCQKVLPLVYDDSLSYYELLNKVVNYLNMAMEDIETLHEDVDSLYQSYVQLQGYVNNYFNSLDVQEEINNKLDEMATDGSLSSLLEPFIPDAVSNWLNEHIVPTSPAIDDTLRISGAGADAKVTGDAIANLNNAINMTKDSLKGHTDDNSSFFNPYLTNLSSNKVGNAYHLTTIDSSLDSIADYPISGDRRTTKLRLTIKNNSTIPLDLFNSVFTLRYDSSVVVNYKADKLRFYGVIEPNEIKYWDFIPSDYVSILNDPFRLFCWTPSGTSVNYTISLSTLSSADFALSTDNDTPIIPKYSDIIEDSCLLAEEKTKLAKLNFSWGVPVRDNNQYNVEFRPAIMCSEVVDLSDYFGRMCNITVSEDFEYRIWFTYTEDINDIYASNAQTYTSNSTFLVSTKYARVIARKINLKNITEDELKEAIQIKLPYDEKNYVVFGNQCDEKECLSNVSLSSATGSFNVVSDRIVSPFIEIPEHNSFNNYQYDNYKYCRVCSLYNNSWGFNFNHAVFFDTNKNITSVVSQGGNAFEVDKTAKYVVVIFRGDSKNLFVDFSAINKLPDWSEYKAIIPSQELTTLSDSISNSDGAITSLLKTALYYYNNSDFGYGNHYTAYHEVCEPVTSDGVEGGTAQPVYTGERYQIDCSAFVRLVLQNITPENSRYLSDKNMPAQSGYIFNDKIRYSNQYGRILANDLAKYAYDNGWLYSVNEDLSNVCVGDLLFLSNDTTHNFFKNIGHTMFVGEKWYNEQESTYKIRAFEANPLDPPIRMNTKVKTNNMLFGARLPLKYCSNDMKNVCNSFDNEEQSINLQMNQYIDFDANLSETLNNIDVITAVVDINMPSNTHIELYANNTPIGLQGAGIWHAKGQPIILHGFINSSELAQNILSIRLFADTNVSGTVKVNSIKIYRSYINVGI